MGETILQPSLASSVPNQICEVYEAARGAMIYGYYFYPIYTIALDQLLRTLELAVLLKCDQNNAPSDVKGFQNGVEHLIKYNIIPKTDRSKWESYVKLRNDTSHPKMQDLVTPGVLFTILKDITKCINGLFSIILT